MRIAIIAWGSLIWDPGDLKIRDGKWYKGGPDLPIELSRLSSGRQHLTYVVDERHDRRLSTRYALSRFDKLTDAIADLACREGCSAERIGYVQAAEDADHHARKGVPWQDIREWVRKMNLDAAIWTDLKYDFPWEWNLDNAVFYWKTEIPIDRLPDAAKYASSAPPEVDTDLRQRLVAEGLIPAHGAIELADVRTAAPTDREQIQGVFDQVVFKFMKGDIDREIHHAKRTLEAERRGENPGPHAGGGNYLAALGLLCYTEYLGAFITGRRGVDGQDKLRPGQGQKNFMAYLYAMGDAYREFEEEIRPARIYNVYRNGFAHQYSAKGLCEVAMLGRLPCGMRKTGNVYEFVVETYFADFMRAAEKLYQELMADPRLPD